MSKKPALFLDRDGVINIDHGYIKNQDEFDFVDDIFDTCKQLQEKGYLLVLVTNQSGIARGLFSEEAFLTLTEWMDWNFVDNGVEFDGIYYCPHHPTAGDGKFTQVCDCRKPAPGMLLTAQQELNIDMANSIMVGDKLSDLQAAKAAGVNRRYLVTSEEAQADNDLVTANIKNLRSLLPLL